jgi:adenylosuccinate lyase
MAGMIDSALFGDLYSTAEMREVWSDRTMIQRWLDVEAALARAEARLGIIPAPAADEISRKVVYELCMDAVEGRMPLRRLLLEDPRVKPYLGETDLDTLLDPARYTGLAARFVDRVAPP